MGFWYKNEIELHLGISAGEPQRVNVYTNWPYYLTRFERCEGFERTYQVAPPEGGRLIQGELDIGEFSYLWLRPSFGSDRAERAFWQARALLPAEPEQIASQFRVAVGERETHFFAEANEPYWVKIETDAAVWIRRLDKHAYATCVQETRYAPEEKDEADAGAEVEAIAPEIEHAGTDAEEIAPDIESEDLGAAAHRLRTYLFPRALLTVRQQRPRYSEEHLEELRTRLQSFRSAA